MPRILIISDVLPTETLTAGIVLNQFINFLPSEFEILSYNIQSDGLASYKISSRITGNLKWTRKPQENWQVPRVFLNLFDLLTIKETKLIIRDIVKDISRQSPDEIFLVMQGQTMFRIAIGLNELGIHFSTFHWDPLSWWLHHNKAPKKLSGLLQSITPILNNSGFHILPSKKYTEYLKLTTDNYMVFNLCHTGIVNNYSPKENVIRVCFSGQSYARIELDFFLRTLDESDWLVNNSRVELHVFGNSYLGDSKNIVHHGWVEPSRLVEELSFYDCALLPYPSHRQFAEVSKYSFPSKYSTYMAASLPVLFIGAEETPFTLPQMESILHVSYGDESHLLAAIESIKEKRSQYVKSIPEIFELDFSIKSQKELVQSYLARAGYIISDDPSLPLKSVRMRSSRDGEQFVHSSYSISIGHFLYLAKKSNLIPEILIKKLYRKFLAICLKSKFLLATLFGVTLYVLSRSKKIFSKD